MRGKEWAKGALGKLGQYKYVLLVALVGALLLLWPSGGGETSLPVGTAESDLFESAAMEAKLERALGEIDGAGAVTVVLTLDSGPRRVLARNGSAQESETVALSKGGGAQEPVELQREGPTYRGALVVAAGGDDPAVRLSITQAVAALTGLGSDKITICKGK